MRRSLYALLILAAAGLCFSGYLSAVKLMTGTCALKEPCPYFLGYPACWYGFAMYLAMFIVTALALFGTIALRRGLQIDAAVSALGILFAGSFAVQELLAARITGVLGLSTCAYGLIMYIAICAVSVAALRRREGV